MKSFFIGLLIFAYSFPYYKEEPKNDLSTIGDVLNAIQAGLPKNISYTHFKKFKDFDFEKFVPIEGLISRKNYVYVFYNDNKDIVKITKIIDKGEVLYDFGVQQNAAFNNIILSVFETSNLDHITAAWVPGIILIHKGHPYFIGQDDDQKYAHFLEKSAQISSVMLLSKTLDAISTIQFNNTSIAFKTQVNYGKTKTLTTETFFKPKAASSISANTNLDDIIAKLNSESEWEFVENRKIALVSRFAQRPLWQFAGNHDYYLNLQP